MEFPTTFFKFLWDGSEKFLLILGDKPGFYGVFCIDFWRINSIWQHASADWLPLRREIYLPQTQGWLGLGDWLTPM